MPLFRTKTTYVRAVQWTGLNTVEVADFVGGSPIFNSDGQGGHWATFEAPGDALTASAGDWIVESKQHGFVLCSPARFAEIYEGPGDDGFSSALKFLREGYKVTRDDWLPIGQYVVLTPGYPDGIGLNAATAAATGIPEGTVRVIHPYLMLHRPDGSFVPWQPTMTDLLATDWLSASADGTITWVVDGKKYTV